jgi:sugar lactone lactonase YvrE
MPDLSDRQPRRTLSIRSLGQALVRGVLPVAACALVLGFSPVLAKEPEDGQNIGDTAVWATTPFPGHPFGIAVDSERVYVSTSRGDFFAGQQNSAGERVFAFDKRGHLLDTTSVETMPNATMGLWGVALDGNRGRNHKLYVADMNGRVLTLDIGQKDSTPRVFATPPAPFNTGDWHTTMWNDLVFDRAGNLIMTDDKPRLWRITPDGQASVWFTDDRLLGITHFAGGPLGGRIDPSGKFFYFSITISAPFPADALIYRLRISDHPTAADLELVHRFAAVPGQIPPQASGIAFAKSGNLYVGLLGSNEIAVLDPSGNEIRRLASPLFDSPWGLAFLGQSLLVSNADIQPVESPTHWIISKVFVGEPGLELNRPKTDRDGGDDRIGAGLFDGLFAQ